VTLGPSFLSVQSLEEALRTGNPPILARMQKGRLVLDMLAVTEEELELMGARLAHLAKRR